MQKVSDNFFVLVTLGIIGTLILSSGVIFFLTSYIKRVARQKAELQKKEMEYQANLFTAVIQSQQEEQRKIGREIHDEAGSLISSIKWKMSNAAQDAPNPALFTESINSIDKLSGIIRNISHLLSPPELELSGFHDALDSLCGGLSEGSNTTIHLQDDAPGFIPKNSFQLSFSLYRIMQELLTNTLKHAGATAINIHLYNEGGRFIIDYRDDGKGADLSTVKPNGLGTQNIESRLMMIHASHKIETAAGKGYRFIIYLEHRYIH